MARTTVELAGVSADIYIDGYKKGIGWGQGPWRTVHYICEWDKSDAFMEALVGFPGTEINGVVYPLPHAYPGNQVLRCVNAEVVDPIGVPRPDTNAPSDEQDKLIAFDLALIEATYRTLNYPFSSLDDPNALGSFGIDPSLFRTQSIRFGYRTYSIPARALQFFDGQQWDDYAGTQDMQMVVPQIEYVYRYEMFPGIPHDLMASLSGSLNAATHWGRERGTLLFMTGAVDPVKSPTGGFLSRAEFSLTWQPVDHNSVVDENSGEFVLVRKRSSVEFGQSVFPHRYEDFSVLN